MLEMTAWIPDKLIFKAGLHDPLHAEIGKWPFTEDRLISRQIRSESPVHHEH